MRRPAVSEEELEHGIAYNVTVADVSAGVQYNMARAGCYFKLGFA